MALSSRIDTGLRARQLGGLYVCFDGGKPKNASSNDPQKKKKKQKSDDQVSRSAAVLVTWYPGDQLERNTRLLEGGFNLINNQIVLLCSFLKPDFTGAFKVPIYQE